MAKCYQCGNTVDQLSKRSRCVDCEYERSIFNEKENERLRAALTASQKALISTTQMLGEIEAGSNHSLPYKVKQVKIEVDLRVMANANALKEVTP
jgi:DNA-directed RNA polymerase subunit RPC12/RpoP